MSRARHSLLRAAVALCLVPLSLVATACGTDRNTGSQLQSAPLGADEEATYEYVVPYGTGNRLDSGLTVEIMPQTLSVKVGESIRITNDDIRDFMVGPFFVQAGQTLAMRFTHAGVLSGVCEINAGGEFVITVTD